MGRALRRVSVAAILLSAPAASAAPILDADPALAKLIDGYQRQQDEFATRELGVSLNPFIKPEHMDLVRSFFAQDAERDFQKFSGKHPYEVVERFNEHEDLGNFGGVACVGVAARFLTLLKAGAPAAELAAARAAVVRAAELWIIYGSIGGPGVVARGVRRVKSTPPLPGEIPSPTTETPTKKSPLWRAPVAKGFDDYIWIDDTSKDQIIGYALATVWIYDALRADPIADPALIERLRKPLVAFARALMKVNPENGVDMVARDSDGRLTTFGDLSSRLIASGGAPLPEESTLRNGFNAAMGAAVIRAAFHVSGQQDIGEFYYRELIGKRDYPKDFATNAGAIYTGAKTNFSNVNMLAMALATLGRIETDTYVRQTLAGALRTQFWDADSDRDVSHIKQGWFDAIYGAYGPTPPSELRARVAENIGGFQPAPAFQRGRINCDEAEIAAGSCLAIDGKTTLALSTIRGHNEVVVAKTLLPMSIRPDTDFAWRGDPFGVNGGAGNRMNPGGDVLAAYWLARLSDLDDAQRNLSPYAVAALPYERGTTPPEEEDAGPNATTPTESSSGCGCRVGAAETSPWLFALLLAFVSRRASRSA